MIGSTDFEPQFGEMLSQESNSILLISRAVFQTIVVYLLLLLLLLLHYILFNTFVKTFSFLVSRPTYINILEVASWPAEPKIFAIWPFTMFADPCPRMSSNLHVAVPRPYTVSSNLHVTVPSRTVSSSLHVTVPRPYTVSSNLHVAVPRPYTVSSNLHVVVPRPYTVSSSLHVTVPIPYSVVQPSSRCTKPVNYCPIHQYVSI
jgi:hypothetical protein